MHLHQKCVILTPESRLNFRSEDEGCKIPAAHPQAANICFRRIYFIQSILQNTQAVAKAPSASKVITEFLQVQHTGQPCIALSLFRNHILYSYNLLEQL